MEAFEFYIFMFTILEHFFTMDFKLSLNAGAGL